ncbi:unnamed protein product [Rotaria sp. Silwood2]|nr:unnamed protein product [Rotaria sp. Silwood2]CAF4264090.1 unnamed protein product [Rotaria sp. Silwood2]
MISTSGTTGRQKVIVHTHKSFSACIAAFVQWHVGVYTFRDQVLQVSTSSWILHIWEIPSTLVVGGTLVLMRPGGHLDVDYFCQTLTHQQVTTLAISPGMVRLLTIYLEISQRLEIFKSVRNLFIGSDTLKPQELIKLFSFLSSFNTRFFILYGMSECHGVIAGHLLGINDMDVPIGYPLPGVQCLLVNESGQVVNYTGNSSGIGEIYIGGQ